MPVDADVAGDERAQPEQRGEVEDVRADDDADADLRVAGDERGDCRRDLGRVGAERGEDAVQALGRRRAARWRGRSARAKATVAISVSGTLTQKTAMATSVDTRARRGRYRS